MRFIRLLAVLLFLLGTVPAFSAGVTVRSIDTAEFPQVKMEITLDGINAAELRQSDIKLFENGKQITEFSYQLRNPEKNPVSVILVIDTSGSMEGKSLESVKQVAKGFIAQKQPEDRLALMEFNTEVKTIVGFTDDQEKLVRSVDSLRAGGDTSLYDAVNAAIVLAEKEKAKNRFVVLFTDGKDTSSKTTAGDALSSIKKAGTVLYAVGSGDVDDETLVTLSEASGGSYFKISSVDSLSAVFERISRTIYRSAEIVFNSSSKPGERSEISLEIPHQGETIRAQTTFVSPEKTTAEEPPPPAISAPEILDRATNFATAGIIIALFFVSFLLLSGALLSGLVAGDEDAVSRLKYYEKAWKSIEKPPEEIDKSKSGMLAVLLKKYGISATIGKMMENAGVRLRVSEFVIMHLILIVAVGMAGNLIGGTPLLVLLVPLAAFAPFPLFEFLRVRRQNKIGQQLPDALMMISYSLRAGYSLAQSLELASQELSDPLGGEFRRIVRETQLGLSFDEALENAAKRINNENFDWTMIAMSIQREVGGNLAELLEKIAEILRERENFKGYVRALSAEGKISANILMALPVVEALLLFLVAPSYISVLFTSPIGIGMMVTALLLMTVGYVWIRRIIDVEQ